MNSKQVKDLAAAAKKNNVFLMEVRLKGFSPSCRPLLRGHLLAVVAIGGTGLVLNDENSFRQYSLRYSFSCQRLLKYKDMIHDMKLRLMLSKLVLA